jgi:uncharacterized circularly permuted ATP-grasp superfamily protein
VSARRTKQPPVKGGVLEQNRDVRVPSGLLDGYSVSNAFCELTRGGETAPGMADPGMAEIIARLGRLKAPALRRRAAAAERELYNLGITFTVYSDRNAIDRILPFDVIPRPLSPQDWTTINTGVKQRVAAMNLFLGDIYNDRKIIKDRVVPRDLVDGNENFRKVMKGFKPAHGTYVHICGTDIVRDVDGTFRVLEDNGRTPSGVSYVIENRQLMQRAFPDLIQNMPVKSVDEYGIRLREALQSLAGDAVPDPHVVVMSPGVFNSAYFEHVFLAREMGVPLVEGRDLTVENDRVYMRTTRGLEAVDVIYRRIDDAFLDPEVFNPESVLGVPGLVRAYLKGTVHLANAVGTGVADDKAIYAYMPRIIKYYLDEDPIIENVQTNICREPDALKYTLSNLKNLVVKPVGESGGYGITIGPKATAEELRACRKQLKAEPHKYISQPVVSLSVSPTLIDGKLEPRHVDLRPFAVTGRDTWVLPGGLTRVALKRGSLIVNSSQGGGTKDTWVLE